MAATSVPHMHGSNAPVVVTSRTSFPYLDAVASQVAIPAAIPTTGETVAAYQVCFFHRTVSGRVIIAGHVIRPYYQDRTKPGMLLVSNVGQGMR